MFCRECGQQLPDEDNFCSKCGKPKKGVFMRDFGRKSGLERMWEMDGCLITASVILGIVLTVMFEADWYVALLLPWFIYGLLLKWLDG